MTTRAELVTQVRFALSELRARNGHHEFETICRELARLRFTPNILPATGPVASGGDQGRDFETFQNQVVALLGASALMLGLRGDELIAFACTLQQDDLEAKIRADVDAICGRGERVKLVVAFCEANLPVAARHRVQGHARDTWDVRLEVFDGVAISDQLAAPDAFWIAVQYLALPTALFPDESLATPTEYEISRETWRERQDHPRTLGDLISLRAGLWFATFDRADRDDVPFWLERLRLLATSEIGGSIRKRARYEFVFGSLRGLGHLRGCEELLRQHLVEAETDDAPAVLGDATILLTTAGGAWLRRLSDLSADEVMDWNERFRRRATDLLTATASPSQRASLLDALGTLRLQADLRSAPQAAEPLPFDVAELDEAREVDESPPVIDPTTVPLIDRDGAVTAWLELARVLADVPLYPVNSLARRVALIAPLISSCPGYRDLTGLLDDAMSRVVGRSAAAERCRDRAFSQQRSGNVLEALREFHQARVDWFSGDTIRGSLLAQIFVAQSYLELGLPTAAKATWLTCSYLAGRSDELADLIPDCLLAAASCDHAVGAWLGANELLELGFRAQDAFAEDPWNTTRHQRLTNAYFEWTVTDAVAGRLGGPPERVVRASTERVGAREIIDEAVGLGPWWIELSDAQFADRISNELGHPAFADASGHRLLRWCALGIEWRLRFATDYQTTIAAERLAAAMQVVCAELATTELCLLRTSVDAEVVLGENPGAEAIPSNTGSRWLVRVRAPGDIDESDRPRATTETIATIFSMLHEASLLSGERLLEAIQTAYREGLADRFSPGLLYHDVYPIDEEAFGASRRGEGQEFVAAEHPRAEHDQLRWRDTEGPGYVRSEAVDAAARRYAAFARLLPLTIERLIQGDDFRRLVGVLRANGWKDWHILQAAASIVWNHRLEVGGFTRDPRTSEEEGRRIAQNPEGEGEPIPPIEAFTPASMAFALQMSMVATLHGWGLQVNQDTPDLSAIEEFLSTRYHYWRDDAEHNALPAA
jgi:hypothetical protein